MKSVVVTGSSTGIGWGAAKVLIAKGLRVFGSVRKPEDGERLARELGAKFTPLLFDVTDVAAVNAAAGRVAAALGGETLAGLVNNAGIAVAGPLLHLDIGEFRHQIEVNLTGQVIVTQAFAPLLMAGADRPDLPRRSSEGATPGRIVMISSVGGSNATPFLAPYCASKFGLEGLSESLRRELMLFGIDVIVVAPGTVATPIWSKAEEVDVSRYAETPYVSQLARIRDYMITAGPKGLKPEALGETIHRALTVPHPKWRYTVTPDPIETLAVKLLPKRWVDRMIAGRLGLARKR
jgi:NAD(P)-dependent dehydrogenase (short-subunit alcohol dehydrogenase family)